MAGDSFAGNLKVKDVVLETALKRGQEHREVLEANKVERMCQKWLKAHF